MLPGHGHFFFQAEDGIRDYKVTGVQTCALPILTCASSIGVRFRIGERYGYEDTSTPRASGLKAGRTTSRSVTRNAGTLTVAPSSSFSFTAGCSWPMMIGWRVDTSSCPWTIVYPPTSARAFSGRVRSPELVAR